MKLPPSLRSLSLQDGSASGNSTRSTPPAFCHQQGTGGTLQRQEHTAAPEAAALHPALDRSPLPSLPQAPEAASREVPAKRSRHPPPAGPPTSPHSPQPRPVSPQSRTGSGPLRRRGVAQHTAPPGGIVPPARHDAPNAAAHPPVGRTIPPPREGERTRPVAPHVAPLPAPRRSAVSLPAGLPHRQHARRGSPSSSPPVASISHRLLRALPPMWSRPARYCACAAARLAGANHR